MGMTHDREVIRRGTYTQNGHRLKFLHHSPRREKIFLGEGEGEGEGGPDVIRTKFPDYYNIIYSSRGEHYSTLWKERRVYTEEAACNKDK